MANNYEVIGKAVVERGGGGKLHGNTQWSLKLLWRGDGSPWWTASSGLEWPCDEETFNRIKLRQRVKLTLEADHG